MKQGNTIEKALTTNNLRYKDSEEENYLIKYDNEVGSFNQ